MAKRNEPNWVDALNAFSAKTKTTLQDCINETVEEELKRPDITQDGIRQAMRMKDSIMGKFRAAVPRVIADES